MRIDKAFCATLTIALAMTGGPVVAQSSDDDLDKLKRQREQLIQQRQQEQKRRTLLEISPTTGTTKAAPASKSDTAVLAPSSGSSTKKTTAKATTKKSTKKKQSTAQQIAKANVPANLAPEDQLFRPIKFAYDSSFLDQTAQETLSGLCATLKVDLDLNPASNYFVIGHTDSAGSSAYNERLSQRRADATKQFLVGECGIASGKLTAVGMGEERLLASAGPRDARQRRVEIQVNVTDSGS